jgi:hypothetical protein
MKYFFLLFLIIGIVQANNITTCTNLSTSNTIYTLNTSISTENNQTCLNITANNITIDCKGESITGINTTFGIYSDQLYTQIINCSISGFEHKIYFDYVDNAHLQYLPSGVKYANIEDEQDISLNTLIMYLTLGCLLVMHSYLGTSMLTEVEKHEEKTIGVKPYGNIE